MRVVQQEGKVIAQFSWAWEVSYLAERGECWVPFAPAGRTDPIGEIHASTHQVRFYPGCSVVGRQAVTLCVVPRSKGDSLTWGKGMGEKDVLSGRSQLSLFPARGDGTPVPDLHTCHQFSLHLIEHVFRGQNERTR